MPARRWKSMRPSTLKIALFLGGKVIGCILFLNICRRMLLEVQKRQKEAETAQPVEEVKPAAPTGTGIGGIDWRAKAEERRLKEMEKNREKDFPTLGGDK